MKQFSIFFLIIYAFFPSLFAQFNVQGDATAMGAGCFRLTPNQNNQEGAVWNQVPLDFNLPFELDNLVAFGNRDGNGADGIAMVFQTGGPLLPPSTLGGSSLGAGGIVPSLIIEMDTWPNGGSGDPAADHIAILRDGSNDHNSLNNLAGPIPILAAAGNVEDGNFYDIKVSWDPGLQLFEVNINCGQVSLSYTGDIVNTVFGGNSLITWGFTSATGNSGRNEHNFCFEELLLPKRDTLGLCEGDTLDLIASQGMAYSWSPVVGLSDPNIRTPRAFPSTSTTYVATITDACGLTFVDSMYIDVTSAAELIIDLGADTTLCPGQSIFLDAYRPGPTYLWQDALMDSARTVSTAGVYWVELTNSCSSSRDTIVVNTELTPAIDFGNDTTLCGPATLTLDATTSNGTYRWQDGSTQPQFQVNTPGFYWAVSNNYCGTATDSIQVDIQPIPPTNLFTSTDTTLCGSAVMNLDVSLGGANYLWEDNATTPVKTISSAGLYWVEVSNYCGTIRDSINVNYDLQPDVFLGNDTTLCTGAIKTLDASWTPSSNYFWQDGSTNSIFQASTSGEYWVRVSNFCGLDVDTIEINFVDPPPPIDFGADTLLCEGQLLQLETNLPAFNHVWQDNSTQTGMDVSQSGTYWVEMSNVCGLSSDTIVATFIPMPQVDLGRDTLVCEGDSLVLDATWPGASYLWDDGFSGPVRTITEPAGYVVTVSNACGVADTGIVVDFMPTPQAFEFGPDTVLCAGDSLMLATDQAGFEYFWQDGSDSMSFVVRSSGSYFLQISNQCAIETDDITVNFNELPEVNLGEDRLLCVEDIGNLVLKVKPSPGQTYLWQDGSTVPSFQVLEGGIISLEVSNSCGTSIDSVIVLTEVCNCSVHVPSAFSPNFDGINDLFSVVPYCNIQDSRLMIFDRWGEIVFETDNPDIPWDGNCKNGPCPEAVYVWVFEYVFPDRNNQPVRTRKSGTLTVIK